MTLLTTEAKLSKQTHIIASYNCEYGRLVTGRPNRRAMIPPETWWLPIQRGTVQLMTGLRESDGGLLVLALSSPGRRQVAGWLYSAD